MNAAAAPGANTTLIVQEAPTAKVVPQLGAPAAELDYVALRFMKGVRPGWMDAESAEK